MHAKMKWKKNNVIEVILTYIIYIHLLDLYIYIELEKVY